MLLSTQICKNQHAIQKLYLPCTKATGIAAAKRDARGHNNTERPPAKEKK